MDIYEKIQKQGYYLIAEIGVNYYDIAKKQGITLMEAAKKMIDEAQNAGVDAVKFQTYKADTLAAKEAQSYWDNNEEAATSQYELFKKFDSFGKEEYIELAQYALLKGIDFLSTPFDFESADYLFDFMDVYKISSSDLSNIPFIEHISKKNKPIILSVGASDQQEIDKAVKTIKTYNDKQIILLHCVLEYPTPYTHANLLKIDRLKARYKDCIIGYSDHTKPDDKKDVLKTAYALGAKVIEKHFTLDKHLKGNDHYHAMDPQDAKDIVKELNFVKSIMGCGDLVCLDTEKQARINARRSIVLDTDVKKGDVIFREMLTFKRPGIGISPDKIDTLIGKSFLKDLKKDTVLKEDMIKWQ